MVSEIELAAIGQIGYSLSPAFLPSWASCAIARCRVFASGGG